MLPNRFLKFCWGASSLVKSVFQFRRPIWVHFWYPCRNHAHNQNNTFKHFYCTSDSWIVLVHADKGSYLLQIYFKFNGLAITTLFVGQDMLNFATEHLPVSVCSHDTDYCLKFRHMGNTNSHSRSLWCQIYMCTGKVHVHNIKLWYCMILSVIALPLVFTKQVNHT